MASRAPAFPDETVRGRFVRQRSAFRQAVTVDGSSGFPAEAGRYHLYVSLACPWAHRTIIVRRLKRLEDAVSLSVVDPIRDARGWRFGDGPGFSPDPVNGFRFLSEAYRASDPGFRARVTVPVLWDRVTGTIVNNESSEIMRMLNSEFDEFGDPDVDLYPRDLRDEIDAVNSIVYDTVNDGVYRAGFATSQSAYLEAVTALFASLDLLEERLSGGGCLVGERTTEADWRLFTTLVRFDLVYVGHFKCNIRRLIDYPNLVEYCRRLLDVPGIAETVDADHIKHHYYRTHPSLNPSGVVPLGPAHHVAERGGR